MLLCWTKKGLRLRRTVLVELAATAAPCLPIGTGERKLSGMRHAGFDACDRRWLRSVTGMQASRDPADYRADVVHDHQPNTNRQRPMLV